MPPANSDANATIDTSLLGDGILTAAAEAEDSFSIALSGGSTPKGLYQVLASDACRDRIDWAEVLVYFADERCVPPDHPDSNYAMVRDSLLARVPIPA